MTFAEQNDELLFFIDSGLIVKNDIDKNSVLYEVNTHLHIGITQTLLSDGSLGKNFIFIKEESNSSTQNVEYHYRTVDELYDAFLDLYMGIEDYEPRNLKEIYYGKLQPQRNAVRYTRSFDKFSIVVVDRFLVSSISICKCDNPGPFSSSNTIYIDKKMKTEEIIPLISEITEKTQDLGEIAKQITEGEVKTMTPTRLELLAQTILANARYTDTIHTEKEWLKLIQNSDESEIRESESSMEIYSQALDAFDVTLPGNVNANGLKKPFLTMALTQITLVFCHNDVTATCEALKDAALRPETEKALEDVHKMSAILDSLQDALEGDNEYKTPMKSSRDIEKLKKEIDKLSLITDNIIKNKKYIYNDNFELNIKEDFIS